MKNNIKYLAILALGLVACEPEFDNPIDEAGVYSSGEADFSNYVALGNSLTAGFADSALYITGQENSYPNILSQQFALVGGGEFTQPLMADNTGGALLGGTQILSNRFVLAFDAEGNPGPAIYAGASPTTEISNNLGSFFNNMGVPGAKSFHLGAPNYGDVAGVAVGTANPYFARFASSAGTSVIADAAAQNPTFFSLWIGNNDILSYATSGGVGVDRTGNPNLADYGSNDITDPGLFNSTYQALIGALTANGAKGVVLNLPNVSTLPFFTTVPFAPLSPLDPNFGPQIPTLNATYAGLNAAFAFAGVPERAISFSASAASPVVIKDESLEDVSADLAIALAGTFGPLAPIVAAQYGQARQATANDLLVLTSSGVIGQVNEARLAELISFGLTPEQAGQFSVNGVSYPMEDQYVLTPAEQSSVENARQAFNTSIATIASENGLAFYNVANDLAQAANGGILFDGGVITSDFVTGGGFSLDGIHPTPRAHALVTNGILNAIEIAYGATLPSVNPGDYGTVTLSNEVGAN
ncbi:G-D-S-L family lipolytic protein [Aquimarina sp. BL5]|uniref:G-D-S-L family lipolytic protein n=1 Tax=Aquimarina sp. BL5 TaxID=1714860 RepID=UPI000E491D0E|nr:G-D-S-L family lipolytic protein [Aquimarina sp. BL5]AXT51380.1 G-D-S-L family lipolytic protein [Aquimarina sp. BL5]RKN05460.1 G-D-S-L family lipolytic protein [Aquimarina sp. BL5]